MALVEPVLGLYCMVLIGQKDSALFGRRSSDATGDACQEAAEPSQERSLEASSRGPREAEHEERRRAAEALVQHIRARQELLLTLLPSALALALTLALALILNLASPGPRS